MIALFGPTGVGKTQTAIELAALLRERGEDPVAISADAIQVYRGLDLLSGKPSAEQLDQLEHRLLSFVPLNEEYSAGQFAAAAHAEIDEALAAGRTPIVVGGTGLYLRAALTELELKPPPQAGLREDIERDMAQIGAQRMHGLLSEDTAGSVHPNDRKRIVRALELERMGERPYTRSDQLWSDELRRPASLFGIVAERDPLAARVSQRVDEMLSQGAAGEVEQAIELGISRTARKALGFRELAAYAAGDVERDEVAAEITRRHLAYAKRQMTWMRKLAGVEIVDRSEMTDADAAHVVLAAVA
ncbi:MAG: tRNA (adenosine(37)-N6)-dimethylallyltransferase MiaA [Solirubrobacterales bacterium]